VGPKLLAPSKIRFDRCGLRQLAGLSILLLMACQSGSQPKAGSVVVKQPNTVRIATFNASLNRAKLGQLADDLSSDSNSQAKKIAEIIQRTRPDILALQEFDFDAAGRSVSGFLKNYLAVSQNGADPIDYGHVYQPTVNTGRPTGLDLNRDGTTNSPSDAHGYGQFEGQYGFVILSKHPIEMKSIRTFQSFLWTQMPNAKLPMLDATTPYYNKAALNTLRLSSKNHVDATVLVGPSRIHLLVSHPTPPVFDGPENRNGLRNHDEIRFWSDYITASRSQYIVDDNGMRGGMALYEKFVVLGDLNADPVDGDGIQSGILDLLGHKRVHKETAQGRLVPSSRGGATQDSKAKTQKGNPAYDTASWGLRVDYVLPSAGLSVERSGVFWPELGAPHRALVSGSDGQRQPSDHRLVWVDIRID